jgi:hypothetical protein
MTGNRKLGLARPWGVAALGLALACGLLSATSALADKGGKKHPPQPPQPPAGWEVIILQPSGYYWSVGYGASGSQQVGFARVLDRYGSYHAGLWNASAGSWVDLPLGPLTPRPMALPAISRSGM